MEKEKEKERNNAAGWDWVRGDIKGRGEAGGDGGIVKGRMGEWGFFLYFRIFPKERKSVSNFYLCMYNSSFFLKPQEPQAQMMHAHTDFNHPTFSLSL